MITDNLYMIDDETDRVSDNFDYSVRDAKVFTKKKFTDLSATDIKAKSFFVLCKVRKTLKLSKFDYSALNILIAKIAKDPSFKGSQYESYINRFNNLIYYKETDTFDFEFSKNETNE